MKAITFTTRNVTAAERDTTGDMVLRTTGDITVTLQGMTRDEVTEWEDITDALNTRGIGQHAFRPTVNGWKVIHPQAGAIGLLFQAPGTRVHVEWYDEANGDFFYAAWTRNLRHGAAAIIGARQHSGQALPADPEPEPTATQQQASIVWLRNGTPVDYHGTLAATFRDLGLTGFRVYDCDYGDCDCGGYELRASRRLVPVAVHVRPTSVTAREPATA